MTSYTINKTAQWFARAFPPKCTWDSVLKLLVHTTESPDWPGYDAGAKAPNGTVRPNMKAQHLDVRQHFPWASSSRALRNEADQPGETNAVPGGVVQLELVGTCDPETSRRWQRSGLKPDVDYIEWWRPPAWAVAALAELWVFLHREVGVPVELGSSRWIAYPASYGATAPQRLHRDAWTKARGLLGHEHAPENVHGDPGAFPAVQLLTATRKLLTPLPAKPPAGTTTPTVQEAQMLSLLVRKPGTLGVSLVTPAGLAPVAKAQALRHGVNLAAWPQGDVYELDASWPGWSLPSVGAHLPAAKH